MDKNSHVQYIEFPSIFLYNPSSVCVIIAVRGRAKKSNKFYELLYGSAREKLSSPLNDRWLIRVIIRKFFDARFVVSSVVETFFFSGNSNARRARRLRLERKDVGELSRLCKSESEKIASISCGRRLRRTAPRIAIVVTFSSRSRVQRPRANLNSTYLLNGRYATCFVIPRSWAANKFLVATSMIE